MTANTTTTASTIQKMLETMPMMTLIAIQVITSSTATASAFMSSDEPRDCDSLWGVPSML